MSWKIVVDSKECKYHALDMSDDDICLFSGLKQPFMKCEHSGCPIRAYNLQEIDGVE